MADAVVIGAGQNGLVAANVLADAGWDVLVLEAEATPGGAVRTEELTAPGFRNDVFSAFYPMTVASPPMRAMDLEAHGLRWRHGELVLAHPTEDGTCAVLSRDVEETVASVDAFRPGDGEAWRRLYARWERVGEEFLAAILSPFPPVGPALRVAGRLPGRDLIRFARFTLLSVRRLAEEDGFEGAGARRLLAGNALHADLTPEQPLGALYAWLLVSLGHTGGWPCAEGGAGQITAALQRRLERAGGEIRCSARVERVLVEHGRAVGVRLESGEEVRAARAVLADIDAPTLFLQLIGPGHLTAAELDDLGRFQFDNATVKVDWALESPLPWTAADAHRSPCIHISEGLDELTQTMAEMSQGLIPRLPFLLLGQYSRVDPTRQPPDRETVWAYTHVPQQVRGDAGGDLTGDWDGGDGDRFADRMEERIERLAPGFRDGILARHVFTPASMPRRDSNLVGGAVNGGTAQLHQQLVFRPLPGLATPGTPIDRLYLASASAHPGGSVHGAAGTNAALAALRRAQRPRRLAATAAGAAIAAAALSRRR